MNNFRNLIQRDLKSYSKYIPEINKSTLRSLFKLCVAFLENKQYSKEAYDKEVAKLIANNPGAPKNYEIHITILMTLIETFSRSRRAGEDIADILRELKFQEECVEDLTKVLTANHETLAESLDAMHDHEPLKNFDYRIDLSRVDESNLQPNIILRFEQQGIPQTINLTMKQFHQLRLATASALQEVQRQENKKQSSS